MSVNWQDLLTFELILLSAASVPGPDVAAIVARGLASGFRATWPLIGGIVAGHSLWMIAAAMGLAALSQLLGPAFVLLKLAGAAYLFFLAWRLWHASPTPHAQDVVSATARREKDWLTGLLVSASNPKAVVFFGAVVPSALPVEALSVADLLILVLASAVVFASVFGTWAAIAARARAALGSTRRHRALHRASALVMAGTGVAIVAR